AGAGLIRPQGELLDAWGDFLPVAMPGRFNLGGGDVDSLLEEGRRRIEELLECGPTLWRRLSPLHFEFGKAAAELGSQQYGQLGGKPAGTLPQKLREKGTNEELVTRTPLGVAESQAEVALDGDAKYKPKWQAAP